MMMTEHPRFYELYMKLMQTLFEQGLEVEVGQWQSQDVRDRPEMVSRELTHLTFQLPIPHSKDKLIAQVQPNLPWAEDHFQERVGGLPLNPPPSEVYWPYAVRGNAAHKEGEQFSHTYPERIWPKQAGYPTGEFIHYDPSVIRRGIRYSYGDLMDVVKMLVSNPLTRQAYLPIWFPEDTGAVAGQRVPCTLGYHFLSRRGVVDIVYYIRSCDLLRHFTDDVYMACRLLQWVVGQLQGHGIDVSPGSLVMHISSLHYFRGDYDRVEMLLRNYAKSQEAEEDDDFGWGAAV